MSGVCSLAVCPVISLPGLAMGLRARRQIRDSNGTEDGHGLALAGLIVNGLGLLYLVGLVVLLALFALASTRPSTSEGAAPPAAHVTTTISSS